MKKKKKPPLTELQSIFVLRGMLATIERIKKDCDLSDSRCSLAVTKAKAGIHGLILALKPYFEEDSK